MNSRTRNLAHEDLTRAVLASFDGSSSERFQTVVQGMVRHLHAFVSDVKLTEEEWRTGIDFLTRTGHITDDKRQEFMLLSDVLGVSMLVVGLGSQLEEATESTLVGPFFVAGSPRLANGGDIARGASGEPCLVQGRVLTVTGEPIADAHIEVWQADDQGFYDVQYEELSEPRGRGHLCSSEDGRYWFWSVKPEAYPLPTDGPVGELLDAANRSPMRPAHLHFMVRAEGLKTLVTHVFLDGDQYLDTDAVFGVKGSLIASFVRHEAGTAPDGSAVAVPYHTLDYDLVLRPSTPAPDQSASR